MSATESESPPVRFKLPFTFGGVANYASAGWGSLLIAEIVMGVIAAVCVLILVLAAWFPAVDQAVQSLPDGASLKDGHLTWPTNTVTTLGTTPFIALTVDPEGGGATGEGKDVQITFGPKTMRAKSLLGMLEVSYPKEWSVNLTRAEMVPRWGAWRPMLLGGVVIATVLGLLVIWQVMGLAHAVVVRLLAFFTDREGGWMAHWRVGAAALIPGALVMSGALLMYGLGRLPLVGLLGAWALHLVIGWIYVVGAPFRLKRKEVAGVPGKGNPFTKPSAKDSPEQKKKTEDNPFK